MGVTESLLRQQGSIIAVINFFLAALLFLLAGGWFLIQKGCNWNYQREASAFFQKIEEKELKYKNINNRYLPFNIEKSKEALKELKLVPDDASYYDFSVEQSDQQTFRIIAQLKPEILQKWYLHSPKTTKFRLIYEKKEGAKGRVVE